MGVGYKAYEPALARYIAIKEFVAHDPALVQRFVHEACAMAALNDPHIIQIHFIEQDGKSLFSLLEGESSLKICQQAARELASAHA